MSDESEYDLHCKGVRMMSEEDAWALWLERKRESEEGACAKLREENERIRREMTRMAAELGVLKGRYRRLSALARTVLRTPNARDYDHALDELLTILTADEAGEK